MKALSIAATLAVALVPLPGSAATLATCSGIAGPPPPGAGLSGRCTDLLTVTGVTTVTMTLEPTAAFAGTLQAAVRKQGAPIGIGFKGLFAGTMLVLGEGSKTFNIDAGTWELEVVAGYLPPCQPQNTPPPLTHCTRPLPAVGSFAGTVTG